MNEIEMFIVYFSFYIFIGGKKIDKGEPPKKTQKLCVKLGGEGSAKFGV